MKGNQGFKALWRQASLVYHACDRWKIFSIRKGMLQHLNTRCGVIERNEENHVREYGDVYESQFYARQCIYHFKYFNVVGVGKFWV